MRRSRTGWITTIVAMSVVILSAFAYGQSKLAEVPNNLPDTQRDALTKQKAALLEERNILKSRIDIHNKKLVPKNSPEERELHREAEHLKSEIQKHEAASRKFNQTVEFVQTLQSPNSRGTPVRVPLTNDVDNRSAYHYFKVIEQFEVESSPRYEPGTKTYCNIFAWDVTRAMGAEIPHWVIIGDKSGASAVDIDGKFKVEAKKREELKVNQTVSWLKNHGKTNGWRRVDARMAQQMANDGHPTIAVWENPDPESSGHITVVRPGSIGDDRGVAIAQSGRLVLDARHIKTGFNDPDLEKPIQYWYHE